MSSYDAHVLGAAAPRAPHFDPRLAASRPLSAFAIIEGGDVFESLRRGPPPGTARAQAYVKGRLEVALNGAPAALADRVRADIVRLLECNPELLGRLEVARPIHVDLVPQGKPFSKYGFPKHTHPDTVGLFWDDRRWDRARMALRQEKLPALPQLAVHEMAHAIHFLAFSESERDSIYRLLLRTFGSRAAVDEVFAIYTEREFVGGWTQEDHRAPGIYGLARQRWREDHVFTRFVRHLYFPDKPLAGPK